MSNYKTIGIISLSRSGSTFLNNHFVNKNNYSIEEFFNHCDLGNGRIADPAMIKLFSRIEKQVKGFDGSNVDFNNRIDQFFFIKKTIKKNIVLKIIPSHASWLDENKIIPIIDNLDFLIFNYRKNLLDSFISLEKAKITGRWSSINHEYRDLKIKWDEKRWGEYLSASIDSLNFILNIYNKFQRKKHMVCYEDFCKNKSRFDYLSDIFEDQIVLRENSICLKKQRKENILEDNFINPLEFLDCSMHNESLTTFAKDISIYIKSKLKS